MLKYQKLIQITGGGENKRGDPQALRTECSDSRQYQNNHQARWQAFKHHPWVLNA